jgi:hypothetical protein
VRDLGWPRSLNWVVHLALVHFAKSSLLITNNTSNYQHPVSTQHLHVNVFKLMYNIVSFQTIS